MYIPDLYSSDTTEIVTYVNQELAKGRSQKDIEIRDFGVNEKVLKNRLSRRGCKKVGNEWVIGSNNNTTNLTTKDATNTIQEKYKGKTFTNKEIEIMNKLLNIDLTALETIINDYKNKKEVPVIRSNTQIVTSVRIDKGIYSLFKTKAKIEGVSVGELLNKIMSDYINK